MCPTRPIYDDDEASWASNLSVRLSYAEKQYGLSPRQLAVMRLRNGGMKRVDIAERLGISLRTYDNTRDAVKAKLQGKGVKWPDYGPGRRKIPEQFFTPVGWINRATLTEEWTRQVPYKVFKQAWVATVMYELITNPSNLESIALFLAGVRDRQHREILKAFGADAALSCVTSKDA